MSVAFEECYVQSENLPSFMKGIMVSPTTLQRIFDRVERDKIEKPEASKDMLDKLTYLSKYFENADTDGAIEIYPEFYGEDYGLTWLRKDPNGELKPFMYGGLICSYGTSWGVHT